MRYRNLGNTGLKVSELGLGAMTFGSGAGGPFGGVNQAGADEMVSRAVGAGVNFFDTADVYSYGESEVVLGRALKNAGLEREAAVVATKVWNQMGGDGIRAVNNGGLSRKHVLASCDASLKRLGTDYVDLYQVHGWDPSTPMEETLRALSDLVGSGKVRYVGASNWSARHLMKALEVQRAHDWAPFVSLQPYYSLVGRDVEHEILPLCREEGLGVLPWSPLASGFLAGKYTRENRSPEGARRSAVALPPVDEESGFEAVGALREVALEKGASVAQVAIAWLLAQPGVTAPILGARKASQLEDNLGAAEVELSEEELGRLSAITAPASQYPAWLQEAQLQVGMRTGG